MPMDVDETGRHPDPSSARACAHPPDARATAQNGALSASDQSRLDDAVGLGFAVLHVMGGSPSPVYPLRLLPAADSPDHYLLKGLARVVLAWKGGDPAGLARAGFQGVQPLVDLARANGFERSEVAFAYMVARALHLSPDPGLCREAEIRDALIKIGKRLLAAHASNVGKLYAFDRTLGRRGATNTSAAERIVFVRSLSCKVTKAELEAAFASPAPPRSPPPAAPPSAQSAAATPVSQRSISMPVETYEVTLQLAKRVSELEAENGQFKQELDDLHSRVALAESGSLAAEKAAAAERARAERAEAASNKLVDGERRRAQRAVDAADEAVRKAEALRDADVRRLRKELAQVQNAYFEVDARYEAARAAAERERELEARVRELEKQLGARQAQLDSAERKLSLLQEHSIVLQKAAAGAPCAASAAAKQERIAERTLKRTAAELESAKASKLKFQRASVLAGERIEGLKRQVNASKRLRGAETAAKLASLTFEIDVAKQKLDAAARREQTLKFAEGELKRERNLARKAAAAADRAAAARPLAATPQPIDEELDEELERAREQNDALARELSAARAAVKPLKLEVARLKAVAEPTCADIKARRTRRAARPAILRARANPYTDAARSRPRARADRSARAALAQVPPSTSCSSPSTASTACRSTSRAPSSPSSWPRRAASSCRRARSRARRSARCRSAPRRSASSWSAARWAS